MKRIAILGSTGSIGQSALKVIANLGVNFKVVALSAHSNTDLLCQQVKLFRPRMAAVTDECRGLKLKSRLGSRVKLFLGQQGLNRLVTCDDIDLIVLAISGSEALAPLLMAIRHKKEIALANKEALVMAGPLVMEQAKKNGVKIIPVDSEQSAIWQCLQGEQRNKLKRIYLTASGGPFWGSDKNKLQDIAVKEALCHPRWKMGRKITVDSATLMNKGLELLEAMYLFGVGPERIKVIIHPEAIIHSMVEYVDGVVMAQLSVTDMRIPIQYAVTYPLRLACSLKGIDFVGLKKLNFMEPDFKKFPCLGLAYRVAEAGGTLPAVMNAANEVSVEAFLRNRLAFTGIYGVISRVVKRHKKVVRPGLTEILKADAWARREAHKIIVN